MKGNSIHSDMSGCGWEPPIGHKIWIIYRTYCADKTTIEQPLNGSLQTIFSAVQTLNLPD